MILEKPVCPGCGEGAVGTVDTIYLCIAEFDRVAGDKENDGNPNEVEYGGNTKVSWDDQETNTNEKGESEVTCENGHSWFTKITP